MFMWAVVLAVGVPSARGNPTAAALVLAKLAGWGWYQITGDNLPTSFYLFPDILVVAVIFSKPSYQPCDRYRSAWHQAKCLVLERSPSDRAVLLIFLVMWCIYVSDLHPYHVWWSLYWLVIIQFLAAGLEALSLYRREPNAAGDTPDNPGALLVAYGGRGYG